jgi:hypothetical protein
MKYKTVAECWGAVRKTLVGTYDAETIETMRHVFVGGALAYRSLLYDSIPTKAGVRPEDEDAWSVQATIDRELDAMSETLGVDGTFAEDAGTVRH